MATAAVKDRDAERGRVRPPEQWDEKIDLSASKGKTEAPATEEGIETGRLERELQGLWKKEDRLSKKQATLQEVIDVLSKPMSKLLESAWPNWFGRMGQSISDAFNDYQSDPWSKGEIIAGGAIRRIKKAADVGGITDPALFDDFRKLALDPFLEQKAKLERQAEECARQAEETESSIVSEQVRRVQATVAIYSSLKGEGQDPSSQRIIELERAIASCDWDRGDSELSKSARRLMKTSDFATRYSVAGMVLKAEDPVEMCRKARDSLDYMSRNVQSGTCDYLEEDLFPLVFTLHQIASMKNEYKRVLHLHILEAELKALGEMLA